MNNYELYLKFIEIASYNTFDAYCKLKEFKKEYKHSEFYRQTKMSLKQAYQMFSGSIFNQLYFKIKDLTDVSTWAIKLNQLMDEIDEDSLSRFVEKITQYFNLDNLNLEKGDLQNLINQLKTVE